MGKERGTSRSMPHMNIKGELGTVKVSSTPDSYDELSKKTNDGSNLDRGGLTKKHTQKEAKKDTAIKKELGDKLYNETKNAINEIIKNSDFGTFRSLRSTIDMIDDHFKSQVETHDSSGAKDVAGRRENENKWFGTDKNASPETYAKYGMLVSKDAGEAFATAPSYGGKIGKGGQVLVTFKDSSVYGRTTLTTKDSLDYDSSNFIPSLITRDGIRSLSGIAYGWWSADGTAKAEATHISDAFKSGAKDGTSIYRTRKGDEYFEVQYHGKYTVRDIETVTIHDYQSIPKSTVAKLEKYGGKAYKLINGKRVEYHGD